MRPELQAIYDQAISRTKLITKLQEDRTRVYTVGFTKVTGEYRIMTCKLAGVDNPYNIKDSNGYVTVYDLVIGEYRTINLENIDYVVIDSKFYWVGA